MLKTYEITIGAFYDDSTYIDVEHRKVQATNFSDAAAQAAVMEFHPKTTFDREVLMREIIRVRRIES